MSAAPRYSTTPTLTFKDVTIQSFSDIDVEVDKHLNSYECTRDIIGNAIGDSDLKPDYEQFKQVWNAMLDDLAKCHERKNDDEKQKCVRKYDEVRTMSKQMLFVYYYTNILNVEYFFSLQNVVVHTQLFVDCWSKNG